MWIVWPIPYVRECRRYSIMYANRKSNETIPHAWSVYPFNGVHCYNAHHQHIRRPSHCTMPITYDISQVKHADILCTKLHINLHTLAHTQTRTRRARVYLTHTHTQTRTDKHNAPESVDTLCALACHMRFIQTRDARECDLRVRESCPHSGALLVGGYDCLSETFLSMVNTAHTFALFSGQGSIV